MTNIDSVNETKLVTTLEELSDAIAFFDRVKSASLEEQIAVGQDHWIRLEAAARAMASIPTQIDSNHSTDDADEIVPIDHTPSPALVEDYRRYLEIKVGQDPLVNLIKRMNLIHEMATRGADKAGCDDWRAQEMCRQIVKISQPEEK
jgi:hypothetical protein